MDFIEQLQQLAKRIPALCEHLQTEEATKNALVMPFIAALGYDVFNPLEVGPELNADYGTKKGEKVDYAIKKDDKIIMLFECKHCGGDLSIDHASQLFRYFSVTEARIGVLTNGMTYRFFTDLESPNKMDEKPFLEVNMLELSEAAVSELKKLTKPAFNLDELMTSAGELKYTREIKRLLAEQMAAPSEEFVKLFASKVYSGVLTQGRREFFTDITKRSFNQLVNERINVRLKSALSAPGDTERDAPTVAVDDTDSVTSASVAEAEVSTPSREDLLETTEEELEGFYIVKSMLRDAVEPSRITHRDTQSYMGILLDDNNRKPLARLYFNRSQKHLGLFDEQRNEERLPIDDLNDIYKHAAKLKRVLAFYEKSAERGDGAGGEASGDNDAPGA
jgi:hypothetical protein